MKFPVSGSIWTNLWIGAAAVLISLLWAAAVVALLLLSGVRIDGAVAVLVFSFLWFGLFFFSLRWQRRLARSLDLKRPCIQLTDRLLTVPVGDGSTWRFKLDEPCQMTCGWFEVLIKSTGGPTTHTRGLMTYVILSQAGRRLLLKAEDSVREAQAAGWPNAASSVEPEQSVRLRASDLVSLFETVRATYRNPS